MPPPPELSDGAGDVGIVEILQEVEAEHTAQADGHIRVGGEIKVDLEGIGQSTHPGQAGVQVGRCLAKDSVGDLAHGVGQHHLFARPKQKRVAPAANSVKLSSRWAISSITVVYRTMGPTTSWGNRATYRATSSGFFWMGASPGTHR